MNKERITGCIEKSEVDKVQPYRAWYCGNIIWFAYTEEEAREELHDLMRKKHHGKNDTQYPIVMKVGGN